MTDAPKHDYDIELGKISGQDIEYANDIWLALNELDDEADSPITILSEWLRKVRYEAVIADRDKRR